MDLITSIREVQKNVTKTQKDMLETSEKLAILMAKVKCTNQRLCLNCMNMHAPTEDSFHDEDDDDDSVQEDGDDDNEDDEDGDKCRGVERIPTMRKTKSGCRTVATARGTSAESAEVRRRVSENKRIATSTSSVSRREWRRPARMSVLPSQGRRHNPSRTCNVKQEDTPKPTSNVQITLSGIVPSVWSLLSGEERIVLLNATRHYVFHLYGPNHQSDSLHLSLPPLEFNRVMAFVREKIIELYPDHAPHTSNVEITLSGIVPSVWRLLSGEERIGLLNATRHYVFRLYGSDHQIESLHLSLRPLEFSRVMAFVKDKIIELYPDRVPFERNPNKKQKQNPTGDKKP